MRSPSVRRVAAGGVLAVLLAVAALGAQRTHPPAVVAGQGDIAGLVDIGGGRRLYLECRGTGGPTVVLEAGYRSPATVWSDDLVQPEMPRTMVSQGVASFTRVCLYERPGVAALLDDALHPSRSDALPQPRTAEGVVADLHALLQAAHIPGPYVLVGHSLGGLFVRLYAATYPYEVLGLVLVDAWYEGLEDQLAPADWAAYVRLNSEVPAELAGYRDYETLDFDAASAVMRRAAAVRPLAPIPLAVLSKGQPFGIPAESLGFEPDALDRAWANAQERLATLAPGARHVVATESAHYVQLQQPALVIEAIRQVVEAVRDPASWPRAATSRNFAGLVDIGGGRRLYLECRGQGSPTVVLEAGYRASARYWTDDLRRPRAPRTMVLPAVAGFTRVCAYDRPGTIAAPEGADDDDVRISRSDPVAQPRTGPEVVADLHALLGAAGVPGPYVLAAHSLGGLFARLYASTYPAEVVGMVLVDAYSERLETLMTPEQWVALVRFNQALGSDMVVPIPGYGDLETIGYGADNVVMREAAAASPLRPMPLAVLAHGRPFAIGEPPAGFTADSLETVLRTANEDLATLVPNARFVVAGESGHDIHQDQPALVIEAIRQVVAGVRHPETWYDLVSCCRP